MELDERTLKDGLKYIVGQWQVDYLVNAWSNDLTHIPATEFKSEDGQDFSAISFEFFEDHTVILRNAANGVEVKGEWDQTGMLSYHYSVKDFFKIPEGAFRDNVEKLDVVDGHLAFSIGVLVVAMKKIKDGVITKEPDIADKEMSKEDAKADAIVGKYAVAMAFSYVDEKFRLCTREEVEAEMQKKKDAGEDVDDDMLSGFEMVVEIAADHIIYQWMKLPAGVPEEEIKKALEQGEIKAVKDGFFSAGALDWKSVDGKYYYNTGEHREVFGEEQSAWDELKADEDGLIPFGSGMMKLKKI